jgi:hypothetical protein
MKIKGITIWEQYVEFFVLILAAAVFLSFTALQFIGNQFPIGLGQRHENNRLGVFVD